MFKRIIDPNPTRLYPAEINRYAWRLKMEASTGRQAHRLLALLSLLPLVLSNIGTVVCATGQSAVQGQQVTAPTSGSTPIEAPMDYRIRPGDLLEVKVDKAEELCGTYRVTSDGSFEMYFLGRVPAENKTSDELVTQIANGLRGRYLRSPRVSVVIKQMSGKPIYIQGAVKSPGTYMVSSRVSLLKLISLSGGLADNHGSSAFIFRESHPEGSTASGAGPAPQQVDANPAEYSFTSVNISGLLKGNLEENVTIELNDIVNIPVADQFFVAGEVRAPGSFALKPGTTLRQAISLAQGFTIQAAPSRGMIFRDDSSQGRRVDMKVDIGAVMGGKSQDIPLKANDVIIIPNSRLKSVGATILRSIGGAAGGVLPRY
jgi:polysaccharide biosynthesis/export protein